MVRQAESDPFEILTLELKLRVLEELTDVAEHIRRAQFLDGPAAKEELRLAHEPQRRAVLANASAFILEKEHSILSHLANGSEVDPKSIDPVIIPVRTHVDADLFRYATLHWSVPVSAGYGRRSRFLIRDRSNGKLVGVFALGDPVIAQEARDRTIGWTVEERNNRLYNVFDAYVLGAVEPYRQLLGGKLVALLALSNEVRDVLVSKYAGSTTTIRQEEKDPTPVLITTTSALGRSSIYNRLTYRGTLMFHSVGFTKGFGHFQFSAELFDDLRQYVEDLASADPSLASKIQSNRYGSGPNWRFRVIRTALELLGIDEDLLRHNVRREVFLAPVASNWDEFLRGETDRPLRLNLPASDLSAYFVERWALPRSERRPEYRNWDWSDARLEPRIAQGRVAPSHSPVPPAPREVQLSPFRLQVGIELQENRRGRIRDVAELDLSQLSGPSTEVTIACIQRANGAREVRGWSSSPGSLFEELIHHRYRLRIQTHPIFEEMSVMDLTFLVASDVKITLEQFDVDHARALLGIDVVEALDVFGEVTVGTRQELLRDQGRRKNQFCAVFPTDDRSIPPVIWALTRVIPVGAQRVRGFPQISGIEMTRRSTR
ncbi:MAG TPA: Druantia anti-phage system protein DruA [Acidimicrobiia bacterium]